MQLVLCVSLQKICVVYRFLRRLFTTHTLPIWNVHVPVYNMLLYNYALNIKGIVKCNLYYVYRYRIFL